jgi:hypothetical protein
LERQEMEEALKIAAEVNNLSQINIGLIKVVEAQQIQILGLVMILEKIVTSPTMLNEHREEIMDLVSTMKNSTL